MGKLHMMLPRKTFILAVLLGTICAYASGDQKGSPTQTFAQKRATRSEQMAAVAEKIAEIHARKKRNEELFYKLLHKAKATCKKLSGRRRLADCSPELPRLLDEIDSSSA